jgi:predicted flap endonuclease-1-like 5' DNA nuclease
MATKKMKKQSDMSTIDILKNKTQDLNKIALKTTDELVEETIATGEQWQNLLAKTLKKSVVMLGKQQDLVFAGLEMLKGQYAYGNKRMKKLLALQPGTVKVKSDKKKAAGKAKSDQNIDQVMAATAKVKVAAKPAAAKKATPAKAKKSSPAAPKAKSVPSATAKSAKLTIIEGIGPKIEELLNKAGIANFDQLAAASPADLKDILLSVGTRFRMHDPSTWPAQAKLAAAGKMEELKVLQNELKGGK